MAELYNYPYIPGKGGISFDEIIQKVNSGENEGEIQTASGRLLGYDFGWNYVGIFDIWEDREYELSATVAEYKDLTNISFLLNTYGTSDYKDMNLANRHHDMYAGHFIKWCMEYFKEQEHAINTVEAVWYDWSINFKEYNDALLEMKPTDAAFATRTGKIYKELGFTHLNERDINSVSNTEGDYTVALFSLPEFGEALQQTRKKYLLKHFNIKHQS